MLEAERLVKDSVARLKAEYEQNLKSSKEQPQEPEIKNEKVEKKKDKPETPEQEKPQQQTAESKDGTPDILPDDMLPEEIRGKSKDTKFHFRRAVQEQAERLLKEKTEHLQKESQKKIEELQQKLEEATKVIEDQDKHLKLFVVKKSADYISAEQKSQEAKKAILELANRLNIDQKDALSLLKDDLVEMALAKKNIKKTYSEDGETFVEVAQSFVNQYLEGEKAKQNLIEASEQQAQKLIEEKQKREQIEKIRKEKERIEAEKLVSEYVTEVILETQFIGKDGVDFDAKQITPEVYRTVREISSTEDGQQQLELLVSQIALSHSLQKQNANLLKEVSKLKQMLKTAGVKYADPSQASAQKGSASAAADDEKDFQSPPIDQINRAIQNRYSEAIRKGI